MSHVAMLRMKLHPRGFVFFRLQEHLSEEDGKEDIGAIDRRGSEFFSTLARGFWDRTSADAESQRSSNRQKTLTSVT